MVAATDLLATSGSRRYQKDWKETDDGSYRARKCKGAGRRHMEARCVAAVDRTKLQ